MTEEEKAVEAEKARVVAEAAAAEAKIDEEDVADVLVKTYADLEKARIERDNYRDGLLKAKGKKADDETDDERIERIVNEKIASSQVGTLLKDFQDKLSVVVKQNKELKVANRSKSSVQSNSGAGGGSEERRETPNNPLSQIPAELQARLANVSEASRNKLIERWKANKVIK